jgi:hypothetical protein
MNHNRRITRGDRFDGIATTPVIGTSKKFALTFGKFKGKTSDKIPNAYLAWAIENCSNIPEDQIQIIKDYLSAE